MKMRWLVRLSMLAAVMTVLPACSTFKDMVKREEVKPWQRHILAKDEMKLEGDSIDSYVDDHMYFSKEASSGGKSVGGGGCGCN